MNKMTETFGMHVFNEAAMEQRLPKDIYKSLQRTRIGGKHFNLDVANVVANAMKEWAVELGATHFTHWFHPMTGITAEKHEAFLSPNSAGKPMLSFSGKALVSTARKYLPSRIVYAKMTAKSNDIFDS
jgi:glutamine synthetase